MNANQTVTLNAYADLNDCDSAIEAAIHAIGAGLVVGKYADPTEGARVGLTIAEVAEVAAADVGLLYVESAPTLRALLAEVEALSRAAGWEGDGYEPTAEDIEYVIDRLGRKPTREEWAETGLLVGSAHVAEEVAAVIPDTTHHCCAECGKAVGDPGDDE